METQHCHFGYQLFTTRVRHWFELNTFRLFCSLQIQALVFHKNIKCMPHRYDVWKVLLGVQTHKCVPEQSHKYPISFGCKSFPGVTQALCDASKTRILLTVPWRLSTMFNLISGLTRFINVTPKSDKITKNHNPFKWHAILDSDKIVHGY